MANVYVYSGGDNTDGSTWAKGYTTLAGAVVAAAVAGNDFWVAHDHAESNGTSQVVASPGTAAAPCRIICASRSGSTPPVAADLATTGSVTTTGSTSITISGYAYVYGLKLNATTGNNNGAVTLGSAAAHKLYLDSCALAIPGTNTSANIQIGTATASVEAFVELKACTVSFGSTSHTIKMLGGNIIFKNCPSFLLGTIPTTLFSVVDTGRAHVLMEGVDFSAAGSGKTILSTLSQVSRWVFKDCKFNASATFLSTPANPGCEVYNIHSAATGINYTLEKYNTLGTQTTETTVVRTGGASDGTTTVAWKIVSGANAKALQPFAATPLHIWLDSTSSTTITMYGINDGGAVAKNNEVWMEVEYLGDASSGQGSFTNTFPTTILTAAANNTTDTSTWGGSTNKFSMAVTFTPAQKGPATIRIYVGAASMTCYIDPHPVISGVTAGKSFALSPGIYVNEISGSSAASGHIIGG